MTENILKLRSIEAMLEVLKSPKAKVFITDGKTPYIIPQA